MTFRGLVCLFITVAGFYLVILAGFLTGGGTGEQRLDHVPKYPGKILLSVRRVQVKHAKAHKPDNDNHEQYNVIAGIYAQAAKRGRKEAQLDEIGCDKGRNSQADIKQLMRSEYRFAFFSQHD